MTERPPHSPCRRNDRHDAHEFEVYGWPFWCPGHAPVPQPRGESGTALRDRIAEALVSWTYRGKDPEHGGILETVRANAYSRADAVLAVLPAPANRAAVASAPVRKTLRRWAYAAGHIEAELDGAVDRMYELIARDVRRMAGETAATETQAADALSELEAAARTLELDRDAASTGESRDYRRGMTRAVQMLRLLDRPEPAAGARQDGA
ncbi:hypothetical protein ACFVOB_22090 [Streptomyces rochei]|uniref:hypothetical protein n=1 Tax=Streptomyces rochei TaxID=1928 RepID=UPI0036AFCB1C